MQSGDFQPYLNYFGIQDYFKCVCAIDNIPKSLKLNHFIICNIDKKNNPGLHWLIFLRYSKSTVVCFDSLSIDDHKKTLLSEYCKFTGVKTILFNETQFQSERSDSCGLFCLYFIIQFSFNRDLPFEFLLESIFKEMPEANEKIITDFFSIFETNK